MKIDNSKDKKTENSGKAGEIETSGKPSEIDVLKESKGLEASRKLEEIGALAKPEESIANKNEKKRTGRNFIGRIIFFIVLFVFLLSTLMIILHLKQKYSSENALSRARELYLGAGNNNVSGKSPRINPKANSSLESKIENRDISSKFVELSEMNPDIKGWISIENTKINNPVFQGKDNIFYLTHDMNRKRNKYGALFFDCSNRIEKNYNSQNLIIHGHHMRDGSMLAHITKYKDINFYKENPLITLDTIYQSGIYKIFAALIIDVDEGDGGYVFNYMTSDFDTQTDFLDFIDEVKLRSLIKTTVDVVEGDELLTLSTCTYEISGANLRFVLMARRIREGESKEVDTKGAISNPEPLYPKIWYKRHNE